MKARSSATEKDDGDDEDEKGEKTNEGSRSATEVPAPAVAVENLCDQPTSLVRPPGK